MENIDQNLYTKDDIIANWDITWQTVRDQIAAISPADFSRSPLEKWSIAEQFEHMIRSVEPLTQGMGTPKMILRSFGKPNRPSRDYAGLIKRYHEKLEEVKTSGATPPSGYAAKEGQALEHGPMLARWEKAGPGLSKGLAKKWDDEELDKFLLPHPLLGKLLVREMMFFTVYHTGFHHMRIEEILAGKWG